MTDTQLLVSYGRDRQTNSKVLASYSSYTNIQLMVSYSNSKCLVSCVLNIVLRGGIISLLATEHSVSGAQH